LSVTIIMPVLMTRAALFLDVSILTIPTNVLPLINVMMLNATNNKDALSLITLTAVLMLTNVMNRLVMMM